MAYVAESGFWVNANFFTTSAFALVLSIFFANFLTKETYGTYQYLFSVYALLTALTLTGMNPAITQAVARGYPNTVRTAILPQLKWNLLPAAVSFGLALYYFLAGNMTIAAGLCLMAIALPLYNTFNSYTAYLAGKADFRNIYLYTCAVSVPYYLCMFAGIYFLRDTLLLVAINLVLNTGVTIFNYYRVTRRIRRDEPADINALTYGRHLTYANFLSTAAGQVDNLLVFHFLGAADLAAYALIRLVPERLGGVFKGILGPAFPRLAKRSPEEVSATIIHRSFLIGISALLLAGTYAVLAPILFKVIYPQYVAFASYSALYSLTLLSSIGNLGVVSFMAQRRTKTLYTLNSIVSVIQLFFLAGGLYLAGLIGLIVAKIFGSILMSLSAIILVRIQSHSPSRT